MTKRLEILKGSLEKKEKLFSEKVAHHFDTVRQANGQPLNDKRNGQATLRKWEKQEDALRNLRESIDKTKRAIELEEGKIFEVDYVNTFIPEEIKALVQSGELNQWRKHPHTFFVVGVDKARIIWDNKKKELSHKYTKRITDPLQWKLFAQTFNTLKSKILK